MSLRKGKSKDSLTVVKALHKDKSPFEYQVWPLPQPTQSGVVPGAWVDCDLAPGAKDGMGNLRSPGLCVWGLHGYITLAIAKNNHPGKDVAFYEMELEGDIVKNSEKAAGRRARLTSWLAGSRTFTLEEIAKAVAANGGGMNALATAATNLGVKLQVLQDALPKDLMVIDDFGRLVSIASYLQAADNKIGDQFERRIWALSSYRVDLYAA